MVGESIILDVSGNKSRVSKNHIGETYLTADVFILLRQIGKLVESM